MSISTAGGAVIVGNLGHRLNVHVALKEHSTDFSKCLHNQAVKM